MYKFSFIFLALLFVACNAESDVKTEDKPSATSQKIAVSNEKLENLKQTIEDNIDVFTLANSLSFRHNDGSTEEVFAYLDKDKSIKKIEEKFANGKTGDLGKRIFYLDKGKKFMSIEQFADHVHAKGFYRERVSYYTADGAVISTMERLSQFEEDLQNLPFLETKKYDCSMKTAEQVLNNQGVFATTFQGFVEDGPLSYLLVGGPGETGYASALAIQFEDEQIRKLKANQKAFVNKPLSIQFEKMLDERDLEFQVLMSMEIQ